MVAFDTTGETDIWRCNVTTTRTFDSANDLWHDAMTSCLGAERLTSRAGPCREVMGYDATLTNVDDNVLQSTVRRMDPAYACAELLWYLSGDPSVEMMCAYAPSYKRFANPQTEDGMAHGAYGFRWSHGRDFDVTQLAMQQAEDTRTRGLVDGVHSQLDGVVKLLKAKPDTRQAVVTMFDSGDALHGLAGVVNDIPCTIALQFLLRGERLHGITYMRSNDAWLGLPYDMFCFSTVQRLVAQRIGVPAGTYRHVVGSMHVYDRDVDKHLSGGKLRLTKKLSKRNGYIPGHGKWDVGKALMNERYARTSKLPSNEVGHGDPIADAAAVCAMKACGRTNEALNQFISPALREAWRIKYLMDKETA